MSRNGKRRLILDGPGLALSGESLQISSMSNLRTAKEILVQLRERNPRFHDKAYLFVLSALRLVSDSLEKRRHISGTELAQGVRRLALQQYGPMARTVLEYWGVHATEDLGEIVFDLVDCGVLLKQDGDSPEDFRSVYDFEDAFERNYPWGRA